MNKALIGASAALLLVGLVFPVGAKLFNPFLAYGIVFVSWPAWAGGALLGAVAGWRAARDQPAQRAQARSGWALCLLNALAVAATLVVPFYVS